MKIYRQEILDGVADIVQSDISIAFCSTAVMCEHNDEKISDLLNKIQASSNPNQIDLYYIKSILVSTGWNKNDDVFTPASTWAARNTPEDKQFNFMHNENDIIGHITGSYVVDREGNKLSEDLTEAPAEFDIITEAVLYNSWSNPENRQRMQNIIAEIEQGKWFVSMECLFAGFDYSVIDSRGEARTVARNEQSSFLTKHLRAYGGTGEYEGYKIGRSLRDISFSGKGLVSKPANPRSVILDSSKAFSVNDSKPYVIFDVNKGESNMSDTEVEKQLDLPQEPTPAVEDAAAQTETPTPVVEASVLEAALAEKETALKAFEAKVAELEAVLASKDKELAGMKGEMDMMKKKEKNRARKDKLVMAGFEDAEAEEALPLYDALADEAFESLVAMYDKKMKKKMAKKHELPEDEKMVEEKNSKAEEVVAEEVSEEVPEIFEQSETTEATLVDASDVNDVLAATRASVAEWLSENVLRK